MKIESVQIARPREITVGRKTLKTGLFKSPVEGPVRVTATGLARDTIVNESVHGGLDQAVYLYFSEDYDWWSEQLGREIEPGTFGENLTVSGLAEEPLRIGDRLQLGDVLLELSAPRLPCAVFATRMGDPSFVKKFVEAVRPGAYARVLAGGEVEAGDRIDLARSAEGHPTLREVFIESHAQEHSPDLLRRILAAPVSSLQRPGLQRWADQVGT